MTRDERLTLTSPGEMAAVTAPVLISWRTSAPILGPGGSYALFVDRAPLQPGQGLRALADDTCKHTQGCPDKAWLADRGVFLTDTDSVVLPYLPTRAGRDTRFLHWVTLVVLDSHGRRAGESVWGTSFRAPAR